MFGGQLEVLLWSRARLRDCVVVVVVGGVAVVVVVVVA